MTFCNITALNALRNDEYIMFCILGREIGRCVRDIDGAAV
jgi:hypothetical protein